MGDVTEPLTGRGGWTPIGKDNGTSHYQHIEGLPLDGSGDLTDINYLAVNLGVQAIQNRVNRLGYVSRLDVDGLYDAETAAGVRWAQIELDLGVDGIFGPQTAAAFWRPIVRNKARVDSVPVRHLWGMLLLESSGDPGAVGFFNPQDLGLFQFNQSANPTLRVEQIFNPQFAANLAGDRLAVARERYAGKTPELQRDCSIAQHNNPKSANQWYVQEFPPNPTIALYVTAVLALGSSS